MAQKAFVRTGATAPEVADGNFRIYIDAVYLDDAEDGVGYNDGFSINVSAGGLSSLRAQVRNEVKAQADTLHGWTLGNEDVYFQDWSRELL